MQSPTHDDLRRLAESQQCWTHPQASVMPLLLAIPTLLDQLAAAEARVARLQEALRAVVSAGESYHRGDEALIVLSRAVWMEASAALRVLEETA